MIFKKYSKFKCPSTLVVILDAEPSSCGGALLRHLCGGLPGLCRECTWWYPEVSHHAQGARPETAPGQSLDKIFI